MAKGRPALTDEDRRRNREIGERIAFLRGRMSQKELAAAIPTSQGNMSKIESGEVTATRKNLEKIAAKLGVKVTDITESRGTAPVAHRSVSEPIGTPPTPAGPLPPSLRKFLDEIPLRRGEAAALEEAGRHRRHGSPDPGRDHWLEMLTAIRRVSPLPDGGTGGTGGDNR